MEWIVLPTSPSARVSITTDSWSMEYNFLKFYAISFRQGKSDFAIWGNLISCLSLSKTGTTSRNVIGGGIGWC